MNWKKYNFIEFVLEKDKLKECAQPYGEITTVTSADLEQIRSLIDKLQENNQVNNQYIGGLNTKYSNTEHNGMFLKFGFPMVQFWNGQF